MAKKTLCKATVIRKHLAKHPKANASEIVTAPALDRIKVGHSLVQVVKARLTKPKSKTEGTDRQKRFWLSTVRIENATQEGEPFSIVLTFSDGKQAILDFEYGDSFAAAELRDALDAWVGLDRFDRYDDRPSPRRTTGSTEQGSLSQWLGWPRLDSRFGQRRPTAHHESGPDRSCDRRYIHIEGHKER